MLIDQTEAVGVGRQHARNLTQRFLAAGATRGVLKLIPLNPLLQGFVRLGIYGNGFRV